MRRSGKYKSKICFQYITRIWTCGIEGWQMRLGLMNNSCEGMNVSGLYEMLNSSLIMRWSWKREKRKFGILCLGLFSSPFHKIHWELLEIQYGQINNSKLDARGESWINPAHSKLYNFSKSPSHLKPNDKSNLSF